MKGMAMKAYLTLGKHSETEYTIQKSRFIGQAAPVANQDAALDFLELVRQKHKAASHHCFAYVIGQNQSVIRYSDDGEPSGTAGKPIADVLLHKNVVDCAVVVTRYFGGILLGAGGLVRAYTHTATLALDAAGICAMHETRRWTFEIAYPQWDRVDHALRSLPVIVENTHFLVNVTVMLLARTETEEQVHAELARVTDGKMKAAGNEPPFYHPWKIE